MASPQTTGRVWRIAIAGFLASVVLACSSGPGVDDVVPPSAPESGETVNPLVTDTTDPPSIVTDSTG